MKMREKFRQVVRLAEVLCTPRGFGALRTWKPFSITAFRMLHLLKKQGLTFETILDCGANVGQFARAAAETYPQAQIYAFEPLPNVCGQLRRNLDDKPQVNVVETALGSDDGTLAFHRNAYSLASSALPLHPSHESAFPGARHADTIEVRVARLDTLLADKPLSSPVLLKLDLQGFEMEALRGAAKTLLSVDYVLIETAFKFLYEGEALFDSLYEHLRSAGFRFLRPIDFLTAPDGEIVQMDALFARTGDDT